jgi:RNA polymerase sigma-70 factor, ECF subfamily
MVGNEIGRLADLALWHRMFHNSRLSESWHKAIDVDRKREQALINASQQGDTEAFTELYYAHVDQVYRYIYYRVESVPVAEDLTADVFTRALESLPTFEDRSIPMLAWLYRIAHARVIDYYRRARHTRNHEDIEAIEVTVEYDLDGGLMAEHRQDAVQAALRTLNDEQQQIIILRFVEGHSLEATAELLGKTVSSVKSQQYRAVRALGRALSSQGFEPDGEQVS